MAKTQNRSDFSEHAQDSRAIWDANARWWDDRIGEGNDFQIQLIEPATERLLGVRTGDIILDIACGAGRFARRMADLGASVVAFDYSANFIERARQRTPNAGKIEYHVIDASDVRGLLQLGKHRFDKAVCTMALMDMPEIEPLMNALPDLLKPSGIFVFSVIHPCFHSAGIHRFCEMYEEEAGRHVVHTGVKVSSYLTPSARKSEGIIGQPEPQYYFHRPLHVLLNTAFREGFVANGIEEPAFPPQAKRRAGLRWDDMPEIPPAIVVRAKLAK